MILTHLKTLSPLTSGEWVLFIPVLKFVAGFMDKDFDKVCIKPTRWVQQGLKTVLS